MSSRMFDKGRDAFLNAVVTWTTHTQKAMLVDMTVVATCIKAITGVTNPASPTAAVYTTGTAHGFSVGDVVVVGNVGGNLSANQTAQIATTPLTTTFTLQTLENATLPVIGSAAYTSGGYVIDLTLANVMNDVNSGREGSDATIGGTSSVRGVATSSSFSWLGVTVGNPVQAIIIYDANPASDASNRVECFIDGKIRVVVDTAAIATATSIAVEPLKGPITNGTVISFSDGHSATLTAPGVMGDRVLTVSSLGAGGVAIGSTADVAATGSGLPVTPNGGNITFTVGTLYGPGGSATPGFTVTGIFEL